MERYDKKKTKQSIFNFICNLNIIFIKAGFEKKFSFAMFNA